MGRGTTLPPQLGQTSASGLSGPSMQAAHQVHSNEQMRASGLSGGRSTSHHSQFGLSSNMALVYQRNPAEPATLGIAFQR